MPHTASHSALFVLWMCSVKYVFIEKNSCACSLCVHDQCVCLIEASLMFPGHCFDRQATVSPVSIATPVQLLLLHCSGSVSIRWSHFSTACAVRLYLCTWVLVCVWTSIRLRLVLHIVSSSKCLGLELLIPLLFPHRRRKKRLHLRRLK